MSLLHPWTALAAAAFALPLLVLLYLLKLRRRRVPIASTLLWRRAHEDLEVNTPFQRLRLSALFALQLLLLLVLIAALAEPAITGEAPTARRIVLLIDRSASMSTVEGDGTRLDAAKRAATEIVQGVARRGSLASVLIVAFGARAEVVSSFESRRDVLVEAIESVRPGDEEANLDAALRLAGTFAERGEAASEEPPDVVLISDGGVRPPEDGAGFALRSGRFRYVRVGATGAEAADNVGIVSLSARRDVDDPGMVRVFVRLINSAPAPVETVVRLRVDDEEGPIRPVRLDGAAPGAAAGEATVTFTIERGGGAVISARHGERDALRADDVAAVVLPPAVRPRIAIVHDGTGPDPRVREMLEESDPRRLTALAIADYEDTADTVADRFDLIVFERTSPSQLPDLPTLTFGATPPGIGSVAATAEGGRRVLSWRRQHPVMRHVSLDTVVFAGFGGLELPAGATELATGPDGPVVATFRARHQPHVVVGFEMARTNWALHVSVAVFIHNVLEYLMSSRTGGVSLVSRPGASPAVRLRSDADALVITPPSISPPPPDRVTLPGAPGAWLTLPRLSRAGVYLLEGAEPPWDQVAVSVLSDVESDVRPRDQITVNAEIVTSGSMRDTAAIGIWPWLVGAAVVLLAVEWLWYCRVAHG